VENPYKKFSVAVVFVLASALSLFAQADSSISGSQNSESVLAAKLAGPGSAVGDNGVSNVPDAPSAAKDKDEAAAGAEGSASPVRKNSQGAPPAAIGPDWSEVRRTADRQYWEVTGSLFAASITDAESTIHCLHVHASCNDAPPSFRSRAALYGIGIPADLGVAYLTYYMKKKHSRIWYVPAAIATGANMFAAVHAYRWAGEPGK
jgi:hypothetical protein